MNITPCKPTKSSITWSEDESISYSYALGKTLSLVGNMVWLFFLLILLVVASIVWLWIASFRAGWRFWSWLDAQPNDQTILATNLVYHFIIMVVSPFALVASWSQKQLQKWLGISFPSEVHLHSIIEEQLGFKFEESGLPCLTKSNQESSGS